ncbi:unnamed protein product, partial [Effrenium voratum]
DYSGTTSRHRSGEEPLPSMQQAGGEMLAVLDDTTAKSALVNGWWRERCRQGFFCPPNKCVKRRRGKYGKVLQPVKPRWRGQRKMSVKHLRSCQWFLRCTNSACQHRFNSMWAGPWHPQRARGLNFEQAHGLLEEWLQARSRPPSPRELSVRLKANKATVRNFLGVILQKTSEAAKKQAQGQDLDLNRKFRSGKPWFEMEATGLARYFVSSKSEQWRAE